MSLTHLIISLQQYLHKFETNSPLIKLLFLIFSLRYQLYPTYDAKCVPGGDLT